MVYRRLDETIVVLFGGRGASPGETVALRVKHPEGTDPLARMRAAIQAYLARRGGAGEVLADWGETLLALSSWDWAAQDLYVERMEMAMILNDHGSLGLDGGNTRGGLALSIPCRVPASMPAQAVA